MASQQQPSSSFPAFSASSSARLRRPRASLDAARFASSTTSTTTTRDVNKTPATTAPRSKSTAATTPAAKSSSKARSDRRQFRASLIAPLLSSSSSGSAPAPSSSAPAPSSSAFTPSQRRDRIAPELAQALAVLLDPNMDRQRTSASADDENGDDDDDGAAGMSAQQRQYYASFDGMRQKYLSSSPAQAYLDPRALARLGAAALVQGPDAPLRDVLDAGNLCTFLHDILACSPAVASDGQDAEGEGDRMTDRHKRQLLDKAAKALCELLIRRDDLDDDADDDDDDELRRELTSASNMELLVLIKQQIWLLSGSGRSSTTTDLSALRTPLSAYLTWRPPTRDEARTYTTKLEAALRDAKDLGQDREALKVVSRGRGWTYGELVRCARVRVRRLAGIGASPLDDAVGFGSASKRAILDATAATVESSTTTTTSDEGGDEEDESHRSSSVEVLRLLTTPAASHAAARSSFAPRRSSPLAPAGNNNVMLADDDDDDEDAANEEDDEEGEDEEVAKSLTSAQTSPARGERSPQARRGTTTERSRSQTFIDEAAPPLTNEERRISALQTRRFLEPSPAGDDDDEDVEMHEREREETQETQASSLGSTAEQQDLRHSSQGARVARELVFDETPESERYTSQAPPSQPPASTTTTTTTNARGLLFEETPESESSEMPPPPPKEQVLAFDTQGKLVRREKSPNKFRNMLEGTGRGERITFSQETQSTQDESEAAAAARRKAKGKQRQTTADLGDDEGDVPEVARGGNDDLDAMGDGLPNYARNGLADDRNGFADDFDFVDDNDDEGSQRADGLGRDVAPRRVPSDDDDDDGPRALTAEDRRRRRQQLEEDVRAVSPPSRASRATTDETEASERPVKTETKGKKRKKPAAGSRPTPTPSVEEDDEGSSDESLDLPPPKVARQAFEERDAGADMLDGRARGTGVVHNKFRQDRNKPGGRRPWSDTETKLLKKLMKEHGNNWAYMISLHGAEGTVSSTFELRNNVSLKDKAVVIKSQLVRAGAPVPPYFECVTCPAEREAKRAALLPAMTVAESDSD